MTIKEMPIEKKYDELLDTYVLTEVINHVLHKEAGTVKKYVELSVEAYKNMIPSYIGSAFKLMKTVSPSRAFKQAVNQLMYFFQSTQPSSNMELTWNSDREAVITTKNCAILKRMKNIVKKTGLDANPKSMCGIHTAIFKEVFKEFGTEISIKTEQNGCIGTIKLT